jgi:hypothetical protein
MDQREHPVEQRDRRREVSSSSFWQTAERSEREVRSWPSWRRDGFSAATRGTPKRTSSDVRASREKR